MIRAVASLRRRLRRVPLGRYRLSTRARRRRCEARPRIVRRCARRSARRSPRVATRLARPSPDSRSRTVRRRPTRDGAGHVRSAVRHRTRSATCEATRLACVDVGGCAARRRAQRRGVPRQSHPVREPCNSPADRALAVGTPWREPTAVTGSRRGSGYRRRLRDAVRGWNGITVELCNYRADGTSFTNRVSLVPVPDATGTVEHWFGLQAAVPEG
jgi:hypothetical protein